VKPNALTKRIAYCYPSSVYAKTFGKHGYYIEVSRHNVEGSGQVNTSPDRSAEAGEVFDRISDPDLWSLYAETEGADRNSANWIEAIQRQEQAIK